MFEGKTKLSNVLAKTQGKGTGGVIGMASWEV